MDSMALLRAHHEERSRLAPDERAAIRGRLDERFTLEAQRPTPRRRRPVVTRGLQAAGACVALGGLVIGGLVIGSPAPAANAAEVLQRASDHAAASGLAGAGTVLESRTRAIDPIIAREGSTQADVATRGTFVSLLKVPEGDEAWERKSWTVSTAYAFGDRTLLARLPDDHATAAHPQFARSRTGVFVNNPSPRSEAAFGDYPDTLRDLPRDPVALLRILQNALPGPGAGSGYSTIDAATIVLTSGVADDELQAAVFQALQKMPDLTIVNHHATDLDGRSGVAIGLEPGTFDPERIYAETQLLIDPTTGQFLGERRISLHDYGVVPAGAEIDSSAYRTDTAVSSEDWTPTPGDPVITYP